MKLLHRLMLMTGYEVSLQGKAVSTKNMSIN